MTLDANTGILGPSCNFLPWNYARQRWLEVKVEPSVGLLQPLAIMADDWMWLQVCHLASAWTSPLRLLAVSPAELWQGRSHTHFWRNTGALSVNKRETAIVEKTRIHFWNVRDWYEPLVFISVFSFLLFLLWAQKTSPKELFFLKWKQHHDLYSEGHRVGSVFESSILLDFKVQFIICKSGKQTTTRYF